MDFYQELHVFGAVPVISVRKKDEIRDEGRIHRIFGSSCGHSLVELAEYDDSTTTADIIVHSMYIDVLLHSYTMCTDNEWTPPRNSGGIP